MHTETTLDVILTGATGMVGEGVLLECLAHPAVRSVLVVGRKHCGREHPKLQEIVIPSFLALGGIEEQFVGYNACFFCAGKSSFRMSEAEYTHITYDTTLHFAEALARLNPAMTFEYISGGHTDSTEQGRVMWARVKGRTENALMRLPFAHVYNLRPGFMRATEGQRNLLSYYKFFAWMYPLLHRLTPNYVSTLSQVGRAMIELALHGYSQPVLEIRDINALASA